MELVGMATRKNSVVKKEAAAAPGGGSIWKLLCAYTMLGIALAFFVWVNVCNFIYIGPWFELAFFLVHTVPIVVALKYCLAEDEDDRDEEYDIV